MLVRNLSRIKFYNITHIRNALTRSESPVAGTLIESDIFDKLFNEIISKNDAVTCKKEKAEITRCIV
jgi:hypothetical protein